MYFTFLTIFWRGRVGAVVGFEWGRVLRVGVWILFALGRGGCSFTLWCWALGLGFRFCSVFV